MELAMHGALRRFLVGNEKRQEQVLTEAQTLLEGKANANFLAHGISPLHMAVTRQNEELVKLLLNYNASPTLAEKKKSTPLGLAYAMSKTEMDDADKKKNAKIIALLEKAKVPQSLLEAGDADLAPSLPGGGQRTMLFSPATAKINPVISKIVESSESAAPPTGSPSLSNRAKNGKD